MSVHIKCSVPLFISVLFIILAVSYSPAVDSSAVFAEGTSVLKGIVSDVEGQAAAGAMVFVYNSPEVRRTADFISAPSDKEGLFRMVLPQGKYWAVARLKKSKEYGPLMPGDRHSGDPEEIEIEPDSEVNMDFVVADLKEAIKMKREAMDRPFRISGKIIDKRGEPVTGAYAIVYKTKEISRIPDYLSAWVDTEGHYTLYIPEGDYYIGGAFTFPPDNNYFIHGKITADADKSGIDIVKKPRDSQ